MGPKVLLCLLCGFAAVVPSTAQMLETETARLLPGDAGKAGGAFEAQTASEGQEGALPLFFEYGLTDVLELSVEPVPYTTIRPAEGAGAAGAGDVELTLTYRLLPEDGHRPAMAAAGEIKVPTAHDTLIGTGETDYTLYYIVSKKLGQKTDLHFNATYAFLGSPPDTHLNNVYGGAIAVVYHLGERTVFFGEAIATSAAASGGEGGTVEPGGITTIVPEAAGSEFVGTAGLGWNVTQQSLVHTAISYDNTSALLLRAGYVFRWGRPAANTPVVR